MSIVEAFSNLNDPKLMKLWSSPTESVVWYHHVTVSVDGINEDNSVIMGY